MEKKKVGVIGCGTISGIYLENMIQKFSDVLEVVACSDLFPEKAEQTRAKYGLKKACTNDEIIDDPDIDIVLNLTIPAVHHDINMRTLRAGKHLYSEKPISLTLEDLNELIEYADAHNLKIGSAPDVCLGPVPQTARKLLDEGVIGDVVGFTVNHICPGNELWHPSPDFLYKRGGGPLMDMGPYYISDIIALLGPVEKVCCFQSEGSLARRPVWDHFVDVEVGTHFAGTMKMKSGAVGSLTMSFDVWNSKLPYMEIFGTKGVLRLPQPNMFGGKLELLRSEKVLESANRFTDMVERRDAIAADVVENFVEEVPLVYDGWFNMRGVGVAEMAKALNEGRDNCLNGRFVRHCEEAIMGLEISAETGEMYTMKTTCEKGAPFSL